MTATRLCSLKIASKTAIKANTYLQMYTMSNMSLMQPCPMVQWLFHIANLTWFILLLLSFSCNRFCNFDLITTVLLMEHIPTKCSYTGIICNQMVQDKKKAWQDLKLKLIHVVLSYVQKVQCRRSPKDFIYESPLSLHFCTRSTLHLRPVQCTISDYAPLAWPFQTKNSYVHEVGREWYHCTPTNFSALHSFDIKFDKFCGFFRKYWL